MHHEFHSCKFSLTARPLLLDVYIAHYHLRGYTQDWYEFMKNFSQIFASYKIQFVYWNLWKFHLRFLTGSTTCYITFYHVFSKAPEHNHHANSFVQNGNEIREGDEIYWIEVVEEFTKESRKVEFTWGSMQWRKFVFKTIERYSVWMAMAYR